jgi:hypothetical protein
MIASTTVRALDGTGTLPVLGVNRVTTPVRTITPPVTKPAKITPATSAVTRTTVSPKATVSSVHPTTVKGTSTSHIVVSPGGTSVPAGSSTPPAGVSVTLGTQTLNASDEGLIALAVVVVVVWLLLRK